jgi:hypothetical protein
MNQTERAFLNGLTALAPLLDRGRTFHVAACTAGEAHYHGLQLVQSGQNFLLVSYPKSTVVRASIAIPIDGSLDSEDERTHAAELANRAGLILDSHLKFLHDLAYRKATRPMRSFNPAQVDHAARIVNFARMQFDLPANVGIDVSLAVNACQCAHCRREHPESEGVQSGDAEIRVFHRAKPDTVWDRTYRFETVTRLGVDEKALTFPGVPNAFMEQSVAEARALANALFTIALTARESVAPQN